MVCFDVKALFPSFSVDKAVEFLERHLRREGASAEETTTCTSVAKTCMKQNYFSFREKTFGLIMGSKTSPFLVNVFMSEFEKEIRSHPNFPRVWWRYVDDVFAVIWLRFLPKILEWLNSLYPSIQLTFEVEEHTQKSGATNDAHVGIYRRECTHDVHQGVLRE